MQKAEPVHCSLEDMIKLYVFIKTLNHTSKSYALDLELFY